jgi:hypothetical protein
LIKWKTVWLERPVPSHIICNPIRLAPCIIEAWVIEHIVRPAVLKGIEYIHKRARGRKKKDEE